MIPKNSRIFIAYIISILFHLSLVLLSSFRLIEGEINLDEYKLVQLVDIKTVSLNQQTQSQEGRLKTTSNTNHTSLLKEDNFSLYLPFFQVARLPEFIVKITPNYPPSAKLNGLEAEVLAEVYIDEKGLVRKVAILKSGGKQFDESVIDALYKSKFRPAISKEGKPIPVRVRIPFKFELE